MCLTLQSLLKLKLQLFILSPANSKMTTPYIFESLRTVRGKGKPSGALYEVRPLDLLATCLRHLQSRTSLDTSLVDDCIIGCVTPIGDQGAVLARTAILYAGWSESVAGMQINRFCGSGLESVNLAAMKIASGWESLVVAGGVESMSRVPMGSDGGALLFDPEVIDRLGYVPQGISADLIASIEGFSRDEVDQYALRSQQRASEAWANGYFDRSVLSIQDVNGLSILEKDEIIRPNTTIEALNALQPAFAKIGATGFDAIALKKHPVLERIEHIHTAGNSSGIVDGAAVVLIGNEEAGKEQGLKARARIRSIATVGDDPTIMLQGPTPAVRKALKVAGMKASDIDLWEMNEAFASPVLKLQRDMNIPDDKLNVNGGAIAMGHPLGATGAMLLGIILDELERRDLSTGLVTLCVGGGMGVATIIERV
ncbi:MAG: acetyl-CoA C-acetyltransferase [Polaribacter sp.]